MAAVQCPLVGKLQRGRVRTATKASSFLKASTIFSKSSKMDNSDVLQLVRTYIKEKADEANRIQMQERSKIIRSVNGVLRCALYKDNGLYVLFHYLREFVERPYLIILAQTDRVSRYFRDNQP